jgi:hypothetical protein
VIADELKEAVARRHVKLFRALSDALPDCSGKVSCQGPQGPITSTSALSFEFGFHCVRISSSFYSSPPAVLTSQRDLV